VSFNPSSGCSRGQQLVAGGQLDARAQLAASPLELVAVDSAPALDRDQIRLASGKQGVDLFAIGVRRLP
jgi:hypothetical protein